MRRFDVKPPEKESPPERPWGRGALPRSVRRLVARAALVLLFCAVTSFYAAIAIQHANPPVIAVQGSSMRPSLSNGDLALLQGVAPSSLRKDDVIAVAVPSSLQTRDHLPPDVERRIVGIVYTAYGPRFTTEADAISGPNPFEVRPSQILGEVIGSIPLVGYAFLFFGGLPGEIVLALLAGAGATYLLTRRRTGHRPNLGRAPVATVEAHGHDDVIRTAETAREVRSPSLGTASDVGQEPKSAESDRVVVVLGELLAQVQETGSQSRASAAVVRELVGAVSEYGAHLRSHTAVLRHLATTTEQLQAAATRLADAVAASRMTYLARPSPEPPAHPSEKPEGSVHPEAAPPRAEVHGQGTPRLVIDTEAWREPFTASELRHPNLPRTTNRYVADTVDRLLDRAADALDLAEWERNSLRDRLSVVEARLALLAARRELDVRTRPARGEAQGQAEAEAEAEREGSAEMQETGAGGRPPGTAQALGGKQGPTGDAFDDGTVHFTHAPPFPGPSAPPDTGAPPRSGESLTAFTRPGRPSVPPVWEVTPPPAP